MRILLFSFYYAKLQTLVFLRLQSTSNPLSLRWRWRYWNRRIGKRSIDTSVRGDWP